MGRRKYFVQRTFQMRYLTYLVGFVLFFVVFTTLALYIGIDHILKKEFSDETMKGQMQMLASLKIMQDSPEFQKQDGFEPALFQNPDLVMNYQRRVLANILSATNMILIAVLALSLPLLAGISVVLSHRTFGSLSRIKGAIRDIGKGDLAVDLHVREQDEMKEFARDITYMARRIKERLRSIQSSVERLDKSYSEFMASDEAANLTDKQRAFMRTWNSQIREIHKTASEFRISSH